MSGVEFNANVLDTLRRGLAIQDLALGWRLLFTGILVLLPALLYPHLNPRRALLAAISLMSLAIVSSALTLQILHLWLSPAAALLALGLSYPLWSWRQLEYVAHSLIEEKERARTTLRSIGEAVIATDAEVKIAYMNPAAEALTGFRSEESRGHPLARVFVLLNQDHTDGLACPVAECLKEGRRIALTEDGILVNRFGKKHTIRATAAPLRTQKGAISGVVLTFSDVTEARRMAQQMAHQANHDGLTQLPNRQLFEDRLSHAIARAQRGGEALAVLFVDLDHFKRINDSLGHAAGDLLLRQVAARLQAGVREEDTVARLGGDEFVILLEDVPHAELATVVARKLVDALLPPFSVEAHEFFITCSIGISLFPKDGSDGPALLKNADTAMYRAKEQGRNTFRFYTAEMNVQILARLSLENELRYALERQQLQLHYQPQLDLASNRLIGVEALLRWHHPERGLIPPADFIPLAEDTGLILPIGEWVLRTACAQAKAWQTQGLAPLRVAVNLSVRQFLQADLAALVAQTLHDTGLAPHTLELEITESLLMRDLEGATVTLRALKTMGVQLAIDDFGIGYSSLSYLKRFPLDRLKIDRSFVRDLSSDPDDAAITLAIIAMAHSLRLRVLAEGVETPAQLAFLRAQHCNEIQGFFCSRPLPAEAMTHYLGTQA
jgi:diguanylate cyclase (GGDEF)-like protein/PAS domain S-box-containing protein